MRTAHRIIVAGFVLLGSLSAEAQDQEYWGAYAKGSTDYEGGEAYGVAWNAPSQEMPLMPL